MGKCADKRQTWWILDKGKDKKKAKICKAIGAKQTEEIKDFVDQSLKKRQTNRQKKKVNESRNGETGKNGPVQTAGSCLYDEGEKLERT